jgi:hypothetical protein
MICVVDVDAASDIKLMHPTRHVFPNALCANRIENKKDFMTAHGLSALYCLLCIFMMFYISLSGARYKSYLEISGGSLLPLHARGFVI